MPIGNPVTLTSNVASKAISVTATASQTLFNVTGGYRINELGVFKNGLRLQDGVDYTARDGLTVTLLSAASGGDKLQFVVFDTFRVAEAIRPNVDEQSIRGNLNVVGILSATNLEGPLSFNLTSGIQTFHDVRVGGALTVAGTLTYEDTTNTNTTGIATFSGGMNISGVGATATTLNVTGFSTFSDNVSIGDSIFHTGDTDTAIRFPAVNTFTVETGGTKRFEVDSNGDVVLGFAGNSLYFQNGFNNSNSRIQNGGATNNSNLKFFTRSSGTEAERLRITSAGLVGIGTNNPNTELEIQSATDPKIRLQSQEAGNKRLDLYIDGGEAVGTIAADQSASQLAFRTAGSERLRIDSSGNVGIGSDDPGNPLVVSVDSGNSDIELRRGNAASNNNRYGRLMFSSMNTEEVAQISAHRSSAEDDAYLTFNTKATGESITEALRIDSSQRVLIAGTAADNANSSADDLIIGNTTQRSGLTIVSGTSVDGNIFFSDGPAAGNANVQGQIVYHHNDHELKFYVAAGKKVTIDQGGGVNISGITTATQLFEGTTRVATTGKAIAMAMLFG